MISIFHILFPDTTQTRSSETQKQAVFPVLLQRDAADEPSEEKWHAMTDVQAGKFSSASELSKAGATLIGQPYKSLQLTLWLVYLNPNTKPYMQLEQHKESY